jgi:type IV secretion system protein VirD4
MRDFSEWPPAAKALAGLFAALLGLVLWSMLASILFLLGTGLIRGHQGIPFAEWWLYWWFYGFDRPIVGVWLKISAGMASGLPLLLLLTRFLRKGWPGDDRPLHGETRWATYSEMKDGDFFTSFAGLFIGKTARGRYLRFGGPEHVACYAPTRSGKGVGLVIPNCLLYEGSLVVLDVKRENWAATAGARAAAGQKVFLFDPLAPDGRTARYNPLSTVRRGTVDAFEDIQRIAQMIFPHVAGDQAFWTDSARSAFIGATALVAETPELPLTIGTVLRLLSSADGATTMLRRIEARRCAGKPYTEATVKALEDYLRGSSDLVNSIRKTITAKLSLWFNPRIDAATEESDFDLRTLRHSLHAIYVGVTPDNIARLRPLLALFFQQLVDLTVQTLPQFDPLAKHQVLVLLDEFPLLGPMPVLADAFAFVAGYNMRLMLIMQSKAQLRDRELYGPDKAAAMLDNCGVEVVFGTKDLHLCNELSERLGYDTVDGISRSGPRFWRMFQGKRLNQTESEQRRALLLPQEIMRLKPQDTIIVRPGMYPIRARRIRYFQDRTFTQHLRKPPVVTPIEVTVRMDQGAESSFQAPPTSTDDDSAIAMPKRKAAPPPAEEPPALRPHQADALLSNILGAQVDLSAFALEDGKAAVAALINAAPTVESLNRGRGIAAA